MDLSSLEEKLEQYKTKSYVDKVSGETYSYVIENIKVIVRNILQSIVEKPKEIKTPKIETEVERLKSILNGHYLPGSYLY